MYLHLQSADPRDATWELRDFTSARSVSLVLPWPEDITAVECVIFDLSSRKKTSASGGVRSNLQMYILKKERERESNLSFYVCNGSLFIVSKVAG